MRCRHCNYLLFNLTHPDCPECGQPFDAAEFRFEPGAVSFHCPHCDQAYYGNDPQGLPDPKRFQCVTCHNEVTLNELRVVPEREGAMGRVGSVWDDRERRGFVSAWWATFKQTLLRPTSFFREHTGRSIGEAWLFSVIACYIGMIPAMAFQFLIMVVLFSGSVPGVPAAPAPPLFVMAVMYGLGAIAAPLIMPFFAGGFYTLATQLALLVLVRHRQPMGTTFRTVLYSMGAFAMYGVPICGSYVGGIWFLVVYINGIKEAHKTSGWIAAVAVLWPVVALICLYLVIIIVFLAPQIL